MGLSDWGSAMLVEKYINRHAKRQPERRSSLRSMYLPTAAITYASPVSNPWCNVSSPVEHVFEKSYINIDGKRYYIYPNIGMKGLPFPANCLRDAELGKDMELRFTGKTVIGDEAKPFRYEAAGITLQGEVPTGRHAAAR